MPTTTPRRLAAALAAAALGLTAACTAGGGGDQSGSGPDAGEKQTIEVWHGWSAAHEVKAFESAAAGFHKAHPNITVKLVKDQTDERISNAIRGGNPPDVVSSFTTDSVGQWCQSGAWQDLNPYVSKSKLDLNQFPKVVQEYTRYKGRRCAMPLLADTYGLYYNKALMKGEQPPKTFTELTALAKKLTKRDPDGTIRVAGFLPSVQYYEHQAQHLASQWGAKWLTPAGKANFAGDPAFRAYLQWNKSLIDWYGYNNVKKFLRSIGQEFESSNPFEKGQVAMAVDGEWRTKFMQEEAPNVDYGTAPAPVPDGQQARYGGGFVIGTVIGIPRGAKHAQAAWEFVRYLTTDTTSLVTFANALGNVPTTITSLGSPQLALPPQFQTFLQVFKNPNSFTTPPTPNGNDYVVKFQQFVQDQWEPGKVSDLDQALKDLDGKVDESLKLAGG
ncbi:MULTISPECIES: ABC transporter substrate-binding protein [Actinomadura]|uniref:Extracellular solute-binding protein n=1 Tax=Actinomadura litoris TaxID=2678616 RepID=A0A7K1KZX2_9ACTN|nr:MULTISPECIES: ABC transporter substrate-binding protein [Actinomadura]MBT2211870.1 ABC transporter substrate-binding protein [Actinomadura sp. NEAU-AAG7]MUN37637.1 extracellular solute-binding protein [Actinomadura litoris]